ncbi:gamma carbonic anhydrase family protein [Actinophytocola xanthii]|uniref:Acyltransferase n=1 Tax=Actinophytocola xanthii TaxID=1912961 RepID=A0A1Q8CRA4_9PSEU|nr:acyltransferase [Actinophytocola xanthii]OLF16889.1 acyltransferase [Actinophytocola xanthii]
MLIRHRDAEPRVDPTAWVAPNATLVGDVRVGPRARVLYGAVLDAEGATVEVGASAIVSEHAVLRATAATDPARPVALGDHAFVGPHATVLGARVDRCAYVAAQATVLHLAKVGEGACVAVGALVHARTRVPAEFFVPPHTTAIGDPVRVFSADRAEELAEAIRQVGFADAAFGVPPVWTDRVSGYLRVAEIRSAEYAAHADDTIIG